MFYCVLTLPSEAQDPIFTKSYRFQTERGGAKGSGYKMTDEMTCVKQDFSAA